MFNVSSALKVASDLSGRLNGLRDVERQLDQLEMRKELLAAAEEALSLREALLSANDELLGQARRISDLEAKIAGKPTVIRVNGLLRELDSNGSPTDVRICDRCHSVEGVDVPMNRRSEGRFICPNCKTPKNEDDAPAQIAVRGTPRGRREF